MTCTAEARPQASFQIFCNETGELVWNGATYIISTENTSHVGYYKCVAKNKLGEKFAFVHLPLRGEIRYSMSMNVYFLKMQITYCVLYYTVFYDILARMHGIFS